MLHKRTITFLISSAVFAAVHSVALIASLYWYFWWFDIVMHFWGGILIGLGIHALATFESFSVRPSLALVLLALLIATVSWELFEWFHTHEPLDGYAVDTTIDIFLGFLGGLIAHYVLRSGRVN